MGQTLSRMGRLQDAMDVYHKCFELPDEGVKDLRSHIDAKVSALLRYGRLLVEENDNPNAALSIYQQAVKMMPDDYSKKQVS